MTTAYYQITRLAIVYSTVYSCQDQRKHKNSASLVLVRGIHLWKVNSPHQWPVTREMFSFDDVIKTTATSNETKDILIHFFNRLFSSFLFKHKTRKHQSSTSLAFVRRIHGWSLDSVHKGPVIRKMFPFLWRHYVTNSWDLPSKVFSLLYPNLVNVAHGHIDLINSITLILFRKHDVLIVLSFRKVPLS